MILLLFLLLLGAVVIAVHYLTGKYGFRNVEYSLHFSVDEAVEGDIITLTEQICSKKLLPLPWIKAELTTDAALEFAADSSAVSKETRFVSSYFCLFPYRRIERQWRVKCTQRGVFSVSRTVLVISDLFSTLEISQKYDQAHAEVTVLPAIRKTETITSVPQLFTGDLLRARTLIPDRFAVYGIREYAEGDAMRDLCLSATMRFQSPMVWQYQETAAPSITVLLNLETRETDREQVSDRAVYENEIRLCAALIGQAAEMQLPVRFCANAELNRVPVDTGILNAGRELHRFLCILAALPFRITGRFPKLLRAVEQKHAVLIITAIITPEILQFAAEHPTASVYYLRPLRQSEMRENIRYIHVYSEHEKEISL